MIVVGGINSPKGILLGTALLQYIEQHYVSWGAPRLILLGAIMLVITLYTTDGLAGIPRQIGRMRHRGAPAADDAAAATMGGGP
jgi:ABC-type branched-subunit amino acid transport system permease subunit